MSTAIPEELRRRKQWLVHRKKIPHYVTGARRTGEQGSPEDRAELATFDEAQAAVARLKVDGVGIALLDGLVGIDLDLCRDPETGALTERAQAIVTACNSYTEISPSGTGLHIYCTGESETFKSNAIGVEVFAGRQYFTVTGNHLAGTPLTVNPIQPDTLRRLKATVEQARRKGEEIDVGESTTSTERSLATNPASAHARRYCLAALDNAVAEMRAASDGARNDTLNKCTFGLAQLIGTGGLSEETIRAALTEAARVAGLSLSEITTTLASAMRSGKAEPRTIPPPRPVHTYPSPESRSSNLGHPDAPPADEWPDPMLPGASSVPELDCALLPGWIGAMAKAVADSTQTPETMSTLLALAVLATCLQRQFEVAPYGDDDDYTEPLALWVLAAMQSGSRKTAVLNALSGPLLRWEKLERDRRRRDIAQVNAARAVARKRIEKLVRDAAGADSDAARERLRGEIAQEEQDMPLEIWPPKLFTGDTTAETLQGLLVKQGERMAVLTDEAGIFLVMAGLYSGGNASLDVFLQGHAGSPVRVDRADREAYLERPALTFGLALQPGVLADVASGRRFRDSGLLARCLYGIPASNVGRRDVRRRVSIPEHVRRDWETHIFSLLEARPLVPGKPRVLPFTDPAREVWLDFAEEIEAGQGEGGKFEAILDWTSKLPGAAARIAGLLELAEVGTHADCVSQVAAERAVEICRRLIPHAHEAFGLLGADSVEGDAMAIIRWAKSNRMATFKRSTAQKAMEGRFRSVDRLIKAAERLAQRDCLREFKEPNRGAPPSVWYRMNPKLFDKAE